MSEIDSTQLLDLARQKSAEGRAALAQTISDLFAEGGGRLTDRERALMFDILHKVVVDVEMSVRKGVSELLARTPDAPRALIKLLANDDIEVAFPMLTRSPVLRDRDLIEVIEHRTLEHQLAVANRYSVSERVSAALVDTGEVGVIQTLLHNRSAQISQATLAFLVEESRRVDSFQEPILRRRELGVDLAKRMFLWVSAALRQFIVAHFALDEATVDALLDQAAFEQIDAADAEGGEATADTLADTLDDDALITPEMLIKAMAQGEVNLFTAMFARMTGLRRTLIMRLLFEPGGEGLAIACKAVDIGREAFSSLFDLSRRARPQAASRLAAESGKALAFFDSVPQEAARRVLQRWQRNPEYLNALRELELETAAHA